MELFIRIKDGQPFEHPILENNFRQAFPDVDTNNLPAEFAKFVRVEKPIPKLYEVLDSEESTYQFIDGVWTDVWSLRDMTAEEKLALQQSVKDEWASMPNVDNYSAWVFDEATCSYLSPIPRPTDGKRYFWQGTTSSWVEQPQYPNDGQTYKLDFPTATWVLVTP